MHGNTNIKCNNNGLLIIPISSTYFGRWFRPYSGALDCVYSLWYNAPTMLPAGSLDEVEMLKQFHRIQATGGQHRGCIIPQAVTHSLVLLRMGEIFSRNMLSWLELLIPLLLHLVGVYIIVSVMHGQTNIKEVTKFGSRELPWRWKKNILPKRQHIFVQQQAIVTSYFIHTLNNVTQTPGSTTKCRLITK